MKRTIAAILAAGTAILGLVGFGSAANASEPPSSVAAVPSGVFISEFQTTGPTGARFEFVELSNRSPQSVHIGGFQVTATFGVRAPEVIATIPVGTVLEQGQVFLLASEESNLPANLFFSVDKDIPNRTVIELKDPSGLTTVDVAATIGSPAAISPTAPLTFEEGSNNWSLQRRAFHGVSKFDFIKRWPATPGVYTPPAG